VESHPFQISLKSFEALADCIVVVLLGVVVDVVRDF
jgi:hypothetical protein